MASEPQGWVLSHVPSWLYCTGTVLHTSSPLVVCLPRSKSWLCGLWRSQAQLWLETQAGQFGTEATCVCSLGEKHTERDVQSAGPVQSSSKIWNVRLDSIWVPWLMDLALSHFLAFHFPWQLEVLFCLCSQLPSLKRIVQLCTMLMSVPEQHPQTDTSAKLCGKMVLLTKGLFLLMQQRENCHPLLSDLFSFFIFDNVIGIAWRSSVLILSVSHHYIAYEGILLTKPSWTQYLHVILKIYVSMTRFH